MTWIFLTCHSYSYSWSHIPAKSRDGYWERKNWHYIKKLLLSVSLCFLCFFFSSLSLTLSLSLSLLFPFTVFSTHISYPSDSGWCASIVYPPAIHRPPWGSHHSTNTTAVCDRGWKPSAILRKTHYLTTGEHLEKDNLNHFYMQTVQLTAASTIRRISISEYSFHLVARLIPCSSVGRAIYSMEVFSL